MARLSAEGKPVKNLRNKYKEIANAYDLYLMCRAQTIIQVEKGSGDSAKVYYVSRTTGLSILPYAGGILDQPNKLMQLFQSFMNGDRAAKLI